MGDQLLMSQRNSLSPCDASQGYRINDALVRDSSQKRY